MNKFSRRDEMLAAIPAVVEDQIAAWEEVPVYGYEPTTKITEGDGFTSSADEFEKVVTGSELKTPFGRVPKASVEFLKSNMMIEAKKSILVKYGRSKYMPHQSEKECAKRMKKMLTNS